MLHAILLSHLLLGTLFLGSFSASALMVHRAIALKQKTQLITALQFSFLCDGVFLFLIASLFLTGTWLAQIAHYHFSIPWIMTAYILFTLISILIGVSFCIKKTNYNRLKSTDDVHFRFYKTLVCLHVIIVACFILMIRDAILKGTMFY